MNATIHAQGLVVLENCITEAVCEELVAFVQPIIDHPKLRNDHLSMLYKKGTAYNETSINFKESASLLSQMAAHVTEICNAYFSIFQIEYDGFVSRFNDPMVKKYSSEREDQFIMHFDSSGENSKRSLSMIWYLNDIHEGGETIFPLHNLSITPKKGSCLVFPPFWNFPHLAKSPISSDKYTLNSFGSVV